MVFQALVRGLDGRTSCLKLERSNVAANEILRLSCVNLSPLIASELVLYSGRSVYSGDQLLTVEGDGLFPTCHVSSRLRGGKGGFGSLLRGQGAGKKKTSNFDACRDMSGRRLRHVNAEKKLKDWQMESKERELEKVAQNYIKKLSKERKKVKEDLSAVVDLRERSEETMDRVAESVKLGIKTSEEQQALEKKRKRKESEQEQRKKKLLSVELGLLGIPEEEEESEEEEEVEEETPEEEEETSEEEEEEEEGKEEEERKAEEATGSAKGEEGMEEAVGKILGKGHVASEAAGAKAAAEQGSSNRPSASKAIIEAERAQPSGSLGDFVGGQAPTPQPETKKEDTPAVCGGKSGPISAPSGPALPEPAVTHSELEEEVPLDWSRVRSSAELESLGLERLKAELTKNGLKCGGTLEERAARLFLLKDSPLGKVDKKHLAQPQKK